MSKEVSLFKDATFWLNKMCITPYTPEERDAIGCLGFDMAKNKDFADKYMAELLKKRHLISERKYVAFSELNLELYRKVLEQPDLEQIPSWITMPDQRKANPNSNGVKARILKMYQNIQKRSEGDNQTTITPPNSR